MNAVIPYELKRVGARSIRYDQRGDIAARIVGDVVYGSARRADVGEIDVIVAGKARYRSGEIILERQRARCIRREGHGGGRCGAKSQSRSAADHRLSGAGDRAVDRDVAA